MPASLLVVPLRPIGLALLVAAGLAAQSPDLLDFARLKSYQAFRVSSNNPDLSSNDDSKRPIPGETVVLADLTGPGAVTHIWITIASSEYGWPRLLRLRVYYDGSDVPSVDAPLGDFFAVGHGVERPIQSALIRNSSSGRSRNSYWVMPFRKRCRITLTNEGHRRVYNLYYHVDWRKEEKIGDDVAYFHARYRQELPARKGQRYEILNVRGRGHYAGTVLSVVQREPGWFGEGDEFLYVDGSPRPSLEGTGTEDYFNDAWSFRVSDGLYTGVPIADGTGVGARLGAYRWHLPDPMPFRQSLRFEIEHAGWTYREDGAVRSAFEERADLFSSVAFWYQQDIARDQPDVPYGAARLPQGNAQQIEAESLANAVQAQDGKVQIQREVFWGRDLLLFQATGVGARLDLPLDVETEDEYEIIAQLAHAPDYGRYRILLDGKPLTGGPLEPEPGANMGTTGVVDAWFTELYVAEDHVLAWQRLTRGKHTLSFVCAGKNAAATGFLLGIDAIVLARVARPTESRGMLVTELRRMGERADPSSALKVVAVLHHTDPEVREAALWTLTQLPQEAARAHTAVLVEALSDQSPVARGLAAIALKQLVPPPALVLPRLIEALRDPDENVRIAVADALTAQGTGAAPAVAALIEACERPGQHVHVLRSAASALGAIGPTASAALPVLEKLERIPRVQWAAAAAIARIRGR